MFERSKWKSLKKELPEIGENILVYKKTYGVYIGYLLDVDRWVINGASGGTQEMHERRRPTHWMPLPELPKE